MTSNKMTSAIRTFIAFTIIVGILLYTPVPAFILGLIAGAWILNYVLTLIACYKAANATERSLQSRIALLN